MRYRYLILLLLLAAPAYAVDTVTIDRDGVTTAADTVTMVGNAIAASSSISTAKSAGNADFFLLRAAPDSTGAGFLGPATGTTTPYYLQLSATKPTVGQVLVVGTPTTGTVNGVTADIIPVSGGTNGTSVTLTDSVSTNSSTTAASATAVKTAYDLANTKGTGTITAVSVATANGVSGTSSGGATPALTISIGAITPSSVLATGLIDGTAPTVLSTTTTLTLGSTYKTNYTYNNYATAGTAITYTLPTAAAGRTECVKNYTGKTGTLRINASAAGQYIVKDGVQSASGGYVISGGALGDGACFVGVDATHWDMYTGKGTWTLN